MTFGITQAVHDQAAAARQEVAKQKESAALTATHEREAIAALAQATTSFADSQSELATGTARVAAGLADPGQPVMLANGEALKRNTFEVMRDFRHAQASLERALAQVQALPASPEQASQRAQAIEEARRALESGQILHARILAAPAPSSPGVLEGGGADLEDLAAQNPRASSDDAEPSAREQHLIGCQVPKPGQVCFEPNDGRIQLVGECKLGLSKVFPALKNALAAVMTRDRLDQTALGTFVLDLIGDIPLVGPLMKAGVAYGAETSVADEPQILTELLFQECERIERALAGERVTGISTGFHDLDKKTSGFHPGELIVIAGRPSMGKCLAHVCQDESGQRAGATQHAAAHRIGAPDAAQGGHRVRPARRRGPA